MRRAFHSWMLISLRMTTDRNFAIDWIKGLMMLFVVLVHTHSLPWLYHGYIAVDIFFFISGYYLMHSFRRNPTTAISYTWRRIKGLYLPYVLCFVFSCLLRYKGLTTFDSFDAFLEKYAQFGFGLTLTEEFGPKIMTEHILLGSWFISVMLIAGALIYGMLEYDEKLSVKVLLPCIVIAGYTFIFTQDPMIMNWGRVGALSLPLVRGFAGMSAGAFIFYVYEQHKDGFERRSTLINIAALLSLVLYVALMFTEKSLDLYLLVAAPWILVGAVIDKSWSNRLLARIRGGFFAFVGRNTLYVLFAHTPAILLVHWTNDHLLNGLFGPYVIVALDLAVTAAASVVLYYICLFMRKKWAL